MWGLKRVVFRKVDVRLRPGKPQVNAVSSPADLARYPINSVRTRMPIPGGYEGVLFRKDAYNAGGDFGMDHHLVVFSNEIDSEFLLQLRYIVKMINKNTIGDLPRYCLIQVHKARFRDLLD